MMELLFWHVVVVLLLSVAAVEMEALARILNLMILQLMWEVMVTDPECHQLTYRLCCQQLTLAAIFSHANFYVLLTGVVLPWEKDLTVDLCPT